MKKQKRGKRRNCPLEDSSNVMYRALRQAGLNDQARRLQIFQCWRGAVGPKIAARTTPEMFRHGVLLVKVANATWQHELTYLKADIITKLNDALGKAMVTELKVICGHRNAASENPDQGPRIPQPQAQDYAAAAAVSSPITDPSVRAAFERLVAKDSWLRRQAK